MLGASQATSGAAGVAWAAILATAARIAQAGAIVTALTHDLGLGTWDVQDVRADDRELERPQLSVAGLMSCCAALRAPDVARPSAARCGTKPVTHSSDMREGSEGGTMSESMAMKTEHRMYGGRDPADVAAYAIGEVSQFLWVREKALRRWATGETGRAPVIHVADPAQRLLSFLNLTELHVLSFLRDQHVPLRKIRTAVDYLRKEFDEPEHPLLSADLIADGVDVFVDRLKGTRAETLANASRHGQLAMRSLLEAHLKRIERDAKTQEILRLYPFAWPVRSPQDAEQQPKPVIIDPRISFGRPVLAGTRIPTSEIASRIRVGESMQSIAEDMNLDLRQVEDALRYHLAAAA